MRNLERSPTPLLKEVPSTRRRLKFPAVTSRPSTLQPASRLRVRGRIGSPHKVYFGVTVRHPNGGFAGRYQTIRPEGELPGGGEFEVVLQLNDFRLDPSLSDIKNKLPSHPFHLVVESMWCHTLNEQTGLAIFEVELIPPEAVD